MSIQAGKYCFIPDNETVFKLVRIFEIHSNENMVSVVEAGRESNIFKVKESDVIPVGSLEELENPPADLIKLQHVHQAGILHTLRSRFQKDIIYTSIGPILVALNPFKWIKGIYDTDIKIKYKTREYNLSDQPHVFAIANDCYSDLSYGQNQSMIISGESGAGKTEATKQCLNYLAYIAGSSSGIQDKILKASPILEAWGNSKTLRNNNSSRFGKYIEIWFDSSLKIVGSSNTTYILEKSRVVRQEKDERNYHVFYQLLTGSTKEELQELCLLNNLGQPYPLDIFHYVNQSGCISIDDVNDASDFHEANQAFQDMGFAYQDQRNLYRIIAAILHLGNLRFLPTETTEESILDPQTEIHFQHIVELFGVDATEFRKSLLFRKIQSGGKRKSIVYAPYQPLAAIDNRDALAKEIYRRCFDWIVEKINALMFNKDAVAINMIGVLDIFGFEIFQKNSFEQLCINLANEALQQHFNYNIFQAEMNIYIQEDVPVPILDFKDNQDVLDLIVKRPKGLIPMLDEEGIVPRGSWEGFLSKFTKQHSTNKRFKFKSKTNELGIVHYAGEVYYDPSLFLIKNKDTLSIDLVENLALSTNSFVKSLFDEELIAQRDASIGSFRQAMTVPSISDSPTPSNSTKDSKQTVGKKFSLQLESLITNLNQTKPRYIRCIKPNQIKKPNIFVHHLTNEQLTYSGVFEAVIIMQNGYPFRMNHQDFRTNYHLLIPHEATRQLIFDQSLTSLYIQRHNDWKIKYNQALIQQLYQERQQNFTSNNTSTRKVRYGMCTRDQCIIMLQYLQEIVYPNQLHHCYVGKTRLFYQAHEHRYFYDQREHLFKKSLLIIQRTVRKFLAKYIVSMILQEEKQVVMILDTKKDQLSQLQQVSKILDALQIRVNHINANIRSKIRLISIITQYTHFLTVQTESFHQIQQLFTQLTSENEEHILQQLIHQQTQLKDVSYAQEYKHYSFVLSWSNDPTILDYFDRIDELSYKIQIKKQFQQGIQTKNELLLEEALQLLHEYQEEYQQKDNNTNPKQQQIIQTYCSEYLTQAKQIIESAREEFETLLQDTVSIYNQGRFKRTKIQSADINTLEYQLEVNPDLLQQFLQFNTHKFQGLSTKAKYLSVTLQEVFTLRKFIEDNKWEPTWELIQTRWKDVIQEPGGKRRSLPIGSIDPNSLKDSVNKSQDTVEELTKKTPLYIPDRLRQLIMPEIKEIMLTAINYFIVPKFQALLEATKISLIPSYHFPTSKDSSSSSSSSSSSFQRELDEQLLLTKQYSLYFDEELQTYMNTIQEIMFIRQSVQSHERERIMNCLKNIHYIPSTHLDYITTKKYQDMYTSIQQINHIVLSDTYLGKPGEFQPDLIRVKATKEGLVKIKGLEIQGDVWKTMLFLIESIVSIRDIMLSKNFTHAEFIIQTIQNTPVYVQLQDTIQIYNVVPGEFLEATKLILNEIRLYWMDIEHMKAVDQITNYLQQRYVVPENIDIPYQIDTTMTGNSNTNNILLDEFTQLLTQLKDKLVYTTAITVLLQSAEKLLEFRQLLAQENWNELMTKLSRYYQETKEFQDINSLFQTEFFSIYYRTLDRHYYETMIQQLSLSSNKSTDSSYLTPSKLDTLQGCIDLINQPSTLPHISRTTRSLFLYTKAIYLLRHALLEGIWEPEHYFFFGKIPTLQLDRILVILEKDNQLSKEMKSVDRIITSLGILSNLLSLEDIEEQINRLNTSSLSILEILYWIIRKSTFSPIYCSEEWKFIETSSLDRRCQVILLLAAVTGKCTGSIERLNYKSMKLDVLQMALKFVFENRLVWTEKTKEWYDICEQLIHIREVIYSHYTEQKTEDVVPLPPPPSSPMTSSPKLPSSISSPSTSNLAAGNTIASVPSTDNYLQHDTLHEKLSIPVLDALLAKIQASNFPVQEIKLIINKVYDLSTYQELLSSINYGAPIFIDQKLCLAQVQYDHIMERLEIAKKLKTRSDRLDRLFFYCELLINLRIAVYHNQWELSDSSQRGDKVLVSNALLLLTSNPSSSLSTRNNTNTSTANNTTNNTTAVTTTGQHKYFNHYNSVTVKRCLNEYKQALSFFQTSHQTMNIPPPIEINSEFKMLEREWERRVLIQRFDYVFRQNNIVGTPFKLEFMHAKDELLTQIIDYVQELEKNHPEETDKDIQMFYNTAIELRMIRQEVKKINESFKNEIVFYHPTNDVQEIVKNFKFIPDAIDVAVATVEQIRPNKHIVVSSKYTGLELIIRNLYAYHQMPFRLDEIECIIADSIERKYALEVSKHFHNIQQTLQNPELMQMTIKELQSSLGEYHKRRLKTTSSSSSSANLSSYLWISPAKKKSMMKSSFVLDFIHDSAVFLIHIYRAKLTDAYDEHDRTWKQDVNFSKTPRILALEQQLQGGKFTIQQLIRAAYKYKLHIHVMNLLKSLENEIENQVSEEELMISLTHPEFVSYGEVGSVVIPEASLGFIEEVMERIWDLRYKSPAVKNLIVMIELISSLRGRLLEGKYEEALVIIGKHYRISEKNLNLEMISSIIHETADASTFVVAGDEFMLLAKETCDQIWQKEMKKALLSNRIEGQRGQIYAHCVSKTTIQSLLDIAHVFKQTSSLTQTLVHIGQVVVRLRELVLIHQQPMSTPWISLKKDPSIDTILQSISSATQTITLLTNVNLHWGQEIVSETTLTNNTLTEIIDTIDHVFHTYDVIMTANNQLETIKTSIIQEYQLLKDHILFYQLDQMIMKALSFQFFSFAPQGLILQHDSYELTMIVKQAEKYILSFDNISEFSTAGYYKLIQGLMKLIDIISPIVDERNNGIVPGSLRFKEIVRPIQEYLKYISWFQLECRHISGRIKHTFPGTLIQSHEALRTAVYDHSTIEVLIKIIHSDELTFYLDSQGRIFFGLYHINSIPYINDKELDVTKPENYEEHAIQVLALLDHLTSKTLRGQHLVDFVRKLIKFRVEVQYKRWLKAKSLLEYLEGHANDHFQHIICNDMHVFQQYIQVIEAQRRLEYHLYQCVLPEISYWSLHYGAQDIIIEQIGVHLQSYLRRMVDGSVSPLPKYKIFEELNEIAYLYLDLLSALRKGVWVSMSDLSDSTNHSKIFPLVLSFGQAVLSHWNNQPIDSLQREALQEETSVLTCYVAINRVLKDTVCLENYMKTFLQREMKKLEIELYANQMEYVIRSTFQKIEIFGAPGELMLSDYMRPLTILCQTLENKTIPLDSCASIKQGWLTSKVIAGYLQANHDGNMKLLSHYMDIFHYLAKLPSQQLLLTKLTNINEATQLDDERILQMEDLEYRNVFGKVIKSFVSTSQPMNLEAEVNKWSKYEVKDDYFMELLLRDRLNLTLKDTIMLPLRYEVLKYHKLFHQHFLFEQSYVLFYQSILDAPATGNPGELLLNVINMKHLDVAYKLLSSYDFDTSKGYVSLLSSAVNGLRMIRQGQKEDQDRQIVEGLNICNHLLRQEESYEPDHEVTLFQLTKKRFLSLANIEIEQAKEDLQQRHIKHLLANALSTTGIPTHDPPYDLQAIDVKSLHEAIDLATAQETSLLCPENKNMLNSIKLLYQIRKMIKYKHWNETLQIVKSHFDEEKETFVDIHYNQSEFFAAWRIASTSKAIELAKACYLSGHLFGTPEILQHKEAIDYEGAKIALQSFDEIRQEWFNDTILSHKQSVDIVYHLRFYYLTKDYHTLYAYTHEIQSEIQNVLDAANITASSEVIVPPVISDIVELNEETQPISPLIQSPDLKFSDIKNHGVSFASKEEIIDELIEESQNEIAKNELTLESSEEIKSTEGKEVTDVSNQNSDELKTTAEITTTHTPIVLPLKYQHIQEIIKPEIKLAEHHSAYIVVTSYFRNALNSNRLLGSYSRLQSHELTLRGLRLAYLQSRNIKSDYPEVQRLQKSAELIYRLRKAQLQNFWVKDDSFALERAKNLLGNDIYHLLPSHIWEEEEEHLPSIQVTSIDIDSGEEIHQTIVWNEAILSHSLIENESVEDILNDFTSIRHSSELVPEIFLELDLAHDELRFRQVLHHLFTGIYSPGFKGVPGQIKNQNVSADLLQYAKDFAQEYPHLLEGDIIKHIYQNVIWLLEARVNKLEGNYEALQEIINETEDYNAMVYQLRMVEKEKKLTRERETKSPSIIPVEIDEAEVEDDGGDEELDNQEELEQSENENENNNGELSHRTSGEEELMIEIEKAEESEIADSPKSLKSSQSKSPKSSKSPKLPKNEDKTLETMKKEVVFPDRLETLPVLSKVWEEVRLLKYDSLFQICLFEFANEVRKEETLLNGNEEDDIDSDLEYDDEMLQMLTDRIILMENILDMTEQYTQEYPSPEFDRLIEAEKLALKLRNFVKDQPHRSPQSIIDQVARIKQRDRGQQVTSYITLLIFELSKMSNVLDFPILLEKVHHEILRGKKYMDKPIGYINYQDITIEGLGIAYQAALPSLEIMGTDENRDFMKMACGIKDMRKCLKTGDLYAAMGVVAEYQKYFEAPLVQDEVHRLRIEMENYDAAKLISHGLKTGRYLNVVAIAKMKNAFEENRVYSTETIGSPWLNSINQKAHFDTISQNIQERKRRSTYHGGDFTALNIEIPPSPQPTATKHTMPSNAPPSTHRRISQGIATMILRFEDLYSNIMSDSPVAPPPNSAPERRLSSFFSEDLPHGSSDYVSSTFIDIVKSSIYALKRAVAVTSRVVMKSQSTEYHLQAAKVILKLRENIVYNNWSVVQELVHEDLDLPDVALEEVNAVREGLLFQRCIEIVADSLLTGAIQGPAHDLPLTSILYSHLHDVIEAFEAGSFQDKSATILVDFVKLVIRLRQVFFAWAKEDIVLSHRYRQPKTIPLTVLSMVHKNYLELTSLLQTFKTFQTYSLGELYKELGLSAAPSSNTNTRGSLGLTSFASEYYWINQLIDAINSVQNEIKMIEAILDYQYIFSMMLTTLQIYPIPILHILKYHENGLLPLNNHDSLKKNTFSNTSSTSTRQIHHDFSIVTHEYYQILSSKYPLHRQLLQGDYYFNELLYLIIEQIETYLYQSNPMTSSSPSKNVTITSIIPSFTPLNTCNIPYSTRAKDAGVNPQANAQSSEYPTDFMALLSLSKLILSIRQNLLLPNTQLLALTSYIQQIKDLFLHNNHHMILPQSVLEHLSEPMYSMNTSPVDGELMGDFETNQPPFSPLKPTLLPYGLQELHIYLLIYEKLTLFQQETDQYLNDTLLHQCMKASFTKGFTFADILEHPQQYVEVTQLNELILFQQEFISYTHDIARGLDIQLQELQLLLQYRTNLYQGNYREILRLSETQTLSVNQRLSSTSSNHRIQHSLYFLHILNLKIRKELQFYHKLAHFMILYHELSVYLLRCQPLKWLSSASPSSISASAKLPTSINGYFDERFNYFELKSQALTLQKLFLPYANLFHQLTSIKQRTTSANNKQETTQENSKENSQQSITQLDDTSMYKQIYSISKYLFYLINAVLRKHWLLKSQSLLHDTSVSPAFRPRSLSPYQPFQSNALPQEFYSFTQLASKTQEISYKIPKSLLLEEKNILSLTHLQTHDALFIEYFKLFDTSYLTAITQQDADNKEEDEDNHNYNANNTPVYDLPSPRRPFLTPKSQAQQQFTFQSLMAGSFDQIQELDDKSVVKPIKFQSVLDDLDEEWIAEDDDDETDQDSDEESSNSLVYSMPSRVLTSASVNSSLFRTISDTDSVETKHTMKSTKSFSLPKTPSTPPVSVFHVLYSINWYTFPDQFREITRFFSSCRNQLIQYHLLEDLEYYTIKGVSKFDEKTARLTISPLYFKFLSRAIEECQRVVTLTHRFAVPFEWTPNAKFWLDYAQRLLAFRRLILFHTETRATKNNIEETASSSSEDTFRQELIHELELLESMASLTSFSSQTLPIQQAICDEIEAARIFLSVTDMEDILFDVISYVLSYANLTNKLKREANGIDFTYNAFDRLDNILLTSRLATNTSSQTNSSSNTTNTNNNHLVISILTSLNKQLSTSLYYQRLVQLGNKLKDIMYSMRLGARSSVETYLGELKTILQINATQTNRKVIRHSTTSPVLFTQIEIHLQQYYRDFHHICTYYTEKHWQNMYGTLTPITQTNNLPTNTSTHLNNSRKRYEGTNLLQTRTTSLTKLPLNSSISTPMLPSKPIDSEQDYQNQTELVINLVYEMMYFVDPKYFLPNKHHGMIPRNISLLPVTLQEQIPFEIYRRLVKLYYCLVHNLEIKGSGSESTANNPNNTSNSYVLSTHTTQDSFYLHRPHWCLVLAIIIYYLHEEIMSLINNSQSKIKIDEAILSCLMLNAPSGLLAFVRELNMIQYLDSEAVKGHAPSQIEVNIGETYEPLPGFYPKNTPNLLILAKYLILIQSNDPFPTPPSPVASPSTTGRKLPSTPPSTKATGKRFFSIATQLSPSEEAKIKEKTTREEEMTRLLLVQPTLYAPSKTTKAQLEPLIGRDWLLSQLQYFYEISQEALVEHNQTTATVTSSTSKREYAIGLPLRTYSITKQCLHAFSDPQISRIPMKPTVERRASVTIASEPVAMAFAAANSVLTPTPSPFIHTFSVSDDPQLPPSASSKISPMDGNRFSQSHHPSTTSLASSSFVVPFYAESPLTFDDHSIISFPSFPTLSPFPDDYFSHDELNES